MSFCLFIIGAAGIAGAIETGTGMMPALIITIIGVFGLINQTIKDQKGEDYKFINYTSSNFGEFPFDRSNKYRTTQKNVYHSILLWHNNCNRNNS